jgi:tetratricopeptide (TPR) repeat protein|uniref:Tetratricopeptide repeat protein n=1 Tax=Desulfobacca acetoxidans TaxID=60893 RepID=A0A7V6DQU2_9BACT
MKRVVMSAVLIVSVVAGSWPVLAGTTADIVKQKSMEAAKDYMTSGNMLAGEGKYGDAVKSYKQAIAMDPNLAEAYSLMGSALAEDGKYQEAEAALRKAISLKPQFSEGYYHLGLFLKSQGRQSEAEEAFRKARQYAR